MLGLVISSALTATPLAYFECPVANTGSESSIVLAIQSSKAKLKKVYYLGPVHPDFLRGNFGDRSPQDIAEIKQGMKFERLRLKNRKDAAVKLIRKDSVSVFTSTMDWASISKGTGQFSYSEIIGYSSHVPFVNSGSGICSDYENPLVTKETFQ